MNMVRCSIISNGISLYIDILIMSLHICTNFLGIGYSVFSFFFLFSFFFFFFESQLVIIY